MNENYENNENFDYMLPLGIPQEESVLNVDNGLQSTLTFFDMHPFLEYKTLDEAQELSERQLRNNVRKLTEEGWLPVSQQKDENLLFNGTNADGTLMFYNPNIHGAIDPETGRRTIQLINPVTMEKLIGYTIEQLPELVVDGLMGGIERNIDGSPKIDEETNSVIDTYLRDWYKDNKDYVDQLSDLDREELFRYLKADHYEDLMKNTKIMFDGLEIHPNYSIIKSSTPNPPKVYTDYINHVVDEAYKATDLLAWLGGPYSAAYYAPRALLDLLRGRYAGALENGTMAVLPFVGRGAGLGKQVASFAAAGLPLSAYYAYEGSPEEALITLGSFAAMPVLGKAVHEMNVPAASAAVADMLKEAADKGAIGYYSALALLSRVFKNATGDMKVLRDKSFKQIENGLEELKEFGKVYEKTLREELSDFRFPQGGGNNGLPAIAYATTDGAYVPYRDFNANKYIFDPKDQITQNGIFSRIKNGVNGFIEGWKGEPEVEPTVEKPKANADGVQEQLPIEENAGTLELQGKQPENINNGQDTKKSFTELFNEHIKNLNKVLNEYSKEEEFKLYDLLHEGKNPKHVIELDGKKVSVNEYFQRKVDPVYIEEICNKNIENFTLNGEGTPKWYQSTTLNKHSQFDETRKITKGVFSGSTNLKDRGYKDLENHIEDLSKKIKVKVKDGNFDIEEGLKELPEELQKTVKETIERTVDTLKKLTENTTVKFDIGKEGEEFTFYDILYPEYGKAKALKSTVKNLNRFKYSREYDQKLKKLHLIKDIFGAAEDVVIPGMTAYGTALATYKNTDSSLPGILGAGIGAYIGTAGLFRGLGRGGYPLIPRSNLGSRITKGINGRFGLDRFEHNPTLFSKFNNYKVPATLTGIGAAGGLYGYTRGMNDNWELPKLDYFIPFKYSEYESPDGNPQFVPGKEIEEHNEDK